jgi:pimeloyl-ACP methyl ester carboxylesterase
MRMLFCLSVVYSFLAPAPAFQTKDAPYSTPGRLIRIDHQRAINLVCSGHGSPTVIFAAGLGDWSFQWRSVQRPLSKRTRVCAWDRAGYGFSTPSPEPQDVIHTTKDLELTLKHARISGPYVMVGHSIGAYEVLRFTDLHRESVVGMLLVDPAIPNQKELRDRLLPELVMSEFQEQLRNCATKLKNGAIRAGSQEFKQCTGVPAVPAEFPVLRQAMAARNSDSARLLTQASAVESFDSDPYGSSHQIVDPRRDFGDMPLIVLTAARDAEQTFQMLGGDTQETNEALRKHVSAFFRDAWVPAHAAYAALSRNGKNRVIDSGHSIQRERPKEVISAVDEILEQYH